MNILLAVDGSEFSDAAIQNLILTRPTDAQVRVIHVIEPFPVIESWVYTPDWDKMLEEQRKDAEAFVAEAAQQLREAKFTVTTSLEQGNPQAVIIDTAAKWPADLIVMGSHGRRGLERFLLGSVSDGIARHAPCSVLIVRKRSPAQVAGAAP
jgi:nucleotide-binding universal stress UspA family protein